MRNYEITFIVDPVLSGGEIKATAQTYEDHLKQEGCTIVNVDDMGLRQLAYTINKRQSGVYFCVEFQTPDGSPIPKVELAMRRDERIMRFLTVTLDKFGVKYNDDKRNGLIGKKKEAKKEEAPAKKERAKAPAREKKVEAPAKEEKVETPAKEAKVEAPVKEEKPAVVEKETVAAPAVAPAPEVKAEEEE